MMFRGMLGPRFFGIGVFMWFIWIGVIIFVIVGLAYVIGHVFNSNFANERHKEYSEAMQVLMKRYAKGEISREEFEQIKKDLLGE